MDNLNLLSQRITFLKNNIQEIIDKCKLSVDSLFINTLNEKKTEYMNDLANTVKELKLSKDKVRIDNEIKKTLRVNDSREYQRLRRKPNSTELLDELKENREKAHHHFKQITEIQQTYSLLEEKSCLDTPGFLFFHKDIINKYGACPNIILTDNIKNERLDWLNSQEDNGQLYRNLYDKYISKVEYNLLLEKKQNLEEYFTTLHVDYLSTTHLSLLNLSEEYLKEYILSNIKTQKIKDKFKIIINNISNIVIETGLKINDFMSANYGIYIPVNIRKDQDNINLSTTGEFITNIYNNKVIEYKNILESIKTSHKFIINSTNNLKQELYEYLYENAQTKKKHLTQTGKYFKRWGELKQDEKLDRYYSYITFFIDKYLVEPNLIQQDQIEATVIIAQTLITTNIKRLKYRDIKWNTKRGTIDSIIPLKYKPEDNTFFLIKEQDKKSGESPALKISKKTSVRTLINRETNKIINDDLLTYIIYLKNDKKINVDNLKPSKDKFLETLKIKLEVKRINVTDKLEILNRFDNIYNIIVSDSNSNSNNIVCKLRD